MPRAVSRRKWFLILAGLALGLLLALNWQWLVFVYAVTTSESRPALLDDADWDDPGSAAAFTRRFAKGTPERDLTVWLRANAFTVDLSNRQATRLVQSLPCNEEIEVIWNAPSDGILRDAGATVREAGCL